MNVYDLVLKGAYAVLPEGAEKADIGVKDGVITAIGELDEKAAGTVWRADGRYVFPGAVDCHVHFSEPGRPDWEGIHTDHGCWLREGARPILTCL